MEEVRIVEVGLRDGLQAERLALSVKSRAELARALLKTGIRAIELGSMVREDWVPQMAKSDHVAKLVLRWAESHHYPTNQLSLLVPNLIGLERAKPTGIKEIAVFASVTERFSLANLNAPKKVVWEKITQVVGEARLLGMKIRGYLSVVWGCPFEGQVPEVAILDGIEKLLNLGCYEISLGDTIGVARVGEVRKILNLIQRQFGLNCIACHFHDTRGQALANILEAFSFGVRVFDSSLGGLGGCPYAPMATGNVATEEVVFLFESLGVKTGVDLPSLLKVGRFLEQKIGRKLPSRLLAAGLPRGHSHEIR